VSSRIELTLTPSLLVGLLAVLPWVLLLAFLLMALLAGKFWLLVAIPIALWGAALPYRLNGLLLGCGSVSGLLIEHDKMYARIGDKQRVEVIPLASSRIWSGLALLKLRPAGTIFRSYTSLLLAPVPGSPGNVPAEDFRRLRVWLRLGRPRRSSH